MTHTSFSKETYLAFKQNDRPGPIHMLNLVRLRDKADYPDGREATGRQAYDAYSAGSAAVLRDLGGSIVWRGSFEQMVIGPQEEQWDICFIAEYPSVKALAHRQAGVADSRLVRLAPMVAGDSFGD